MLHYVCLFVCLFVCFFFAIESKFLHGRHNGIMVISYSGKLLREKTFANFAVLWLVAKVFSAKFGGVVSFAVAKVSNS